MGSSAGVKYCPEMRCNFYPGIAPNAFSVLIHAGGRDVLFCPFFLHSFFAKYRDQLISLFYSSWSGAIWCLQSPCGWSAQLSGEERAGTPAERVWKRQIFMGSVGVHFLWPLILLAGKIAG